MLARIPKIAWSIMCFLYEQRDLIPRTHILKMRWGGVVVPAYNPTGGPPECTGQPVYPNW